MNEYVGMLSMLASTTVSPENGRIDWGACNCLYIADVRNVLTHSAAVDATGRCCGSSVPQRSKEYKVLAGL